MIFDATGFTFRAPDVLSRARRVLIKPAAGYPVPYPVTTSAETLASVIRGIRQISEADIILLEGTTDGSPVYPIFQELGYNFPRVISLDVRDSIWLEIENPLPKPFALPTFWVPNVILSSDYLISIAPMKVINDHGYFSIMNLLSTLPESKYDSQSHHSWGALYELGIDKVISDLYFTIPFDLGIIEGKQVFASDGDPVNGRSEAFGKIFVGEPYEVDQEASAALGIRNEYLNLIREVKVGLGI